jgi:lysophospholipase L1-like esterase
LLALASTAVVLGLGVALEGLLRLRAHAEGGERGLESLHVYSETYGWTLRRGFRHRADARTISVNRLGYRGREHGLVRTDGVPRVVMLGDSIAFGPGVDDTETFSHRLDSGAGGPEVVNLGVMGYGTDQALLKLEREGLAFGPDVVVLHFCLYNDFADNMLPRALYDGVHPKPYFTYEGEELRKHDAHLRTSPARRLALHLQTSSHLFRRVTAVAGGGGVHWLDRMEVALENVGQATELAFRLIETMRKRADEIGARFVVMVHPDESAFRHQSRLTEKFDRSPRLKGTTVIVMADAYRARSLRWEDFALDSLGHLNPAGHRVVADVLRGVLDARMASGTGVHAIPGARAQS